MKNRRSHVTRRMSAFRGKPEVMRISPNCRFWTHFRLKPPRDMVREKPPNANPPFGDSG